VAGITAWLLKHNETHTHNESDDIATLYALPFLDERFRQVTVDSFNPVTVVQLHHISHL
jgi:hypothetical protein